ncbi:MAG TPA: hypothetical protein VFH47_03890 [Candidatus Thermoplasmatota archaeon]|nr:hypothetical protein [Candidatus Thermoplasmatota archaeon]
MPFLLQGKMAALLPGKLDARLPGKLPVVLPGKLPVLLPACCRRLPRLLRICQVDAARGQALRGSWGQRRRWNRPPASAPG